MGGTHRMGDVLAGFRATEDAETGARELIERLLRAVRQHLDLDVAFVGEVVGDERVFRYVDTKPGAAVLTAGERDPLDAAYCGHVLSGRLPELLVDPSQHPVSRHMPVTAQLPVGSHLSVPIRFSDGRTYGTFCCFSLDVRRSLTPSALSPLRMVAQLAAEYLEAIDDAQARQRRRLRTVTEVIDDPGAMMVVFQPLRDLDTMEIVAVEALSRFPKHGHRPDWLFKEAVEVGLGQKLDMRAVQMALAAFDDIPAPIRLNVNVSPATLCSEDFFEAIDDVPADRLVVEVTEHAATDDYAELRDASNRLAASGIRLAIDDVGMGFSGLNRILQSSPEELKLDAVVIRDVDVSPVKQALIESFCSFGRRAGLDIVGEGIETEAELDALRALGVTCGQGYHLGRPAPLDETLAATRARADFRGLQDASGLNASRAVHRSAKA